MSRVAASRWPQGTGVPCLTNDRGIQVSISVKIAAGTRAQAPLTFVEVLIADHFSFVFCRATSRPPLENSFGRTVSPGSIIRFTGVALEFLVDPSTTPFHPVSPEEFPFSAETRFYIRVSNISPIEDRKLSSPARHAGCCESLAGDSGNFEGNE